MDKIPSEKLPILRDKYNFHNRYEKLKGVLRDPSSENIMLSVSQQFTDKQLREILVESNDFSSSTYSRQN